MPLPPPEPAFHWSEDGSGPVLRCGPLDRIAQHVFTSKQLELTSDAWAVAADAVGVDAQRVFRVKQVHGRTVRVLSRADVAAHDPTQRPEGDAIVSNVPGLAMSVSVADCVPILIANDRVGAAAAIHAGWRGTCAGVVSAAVETMQRELGVEPSDCTAAIGPSIGPEDYQVGDEVMAAFLEAGHPRADVERWFRRRGEKLTLDLWSANRDQLLGAGVPGSRIFVCGLSTLAYPRVFESFRAEGRRAGRMAALVVVPPASIRGRR